jgi:choline dehydrogenase-like flavoprotein
MSGPDVVVVGAGASGCALAGRLAEDGRRVVLVEAGSAGGYRGLDPFTALAAPGRAWDDTTAVHVDGSSPSLYLQGRAVGGSTAVNGMLVEWPAATDLDAWGVESWSAATLRPTIASVARRLPGRPVPALGPLNQAIWVAAESAGLGSRVERLQFTTDGGRRLSVAAAFLGSRDEQHGNLALRSEAPVADVMLDGRRAVGVRLGDGHLIEAAEVVLCGGAIHSPLLLQRAGIDRPGVGRNLQDHPAVQFGIELAPAGQVADCERLPFGIGIRHGSLLILPVDHTGEVGRGSVVVALLAAHSRGTVDADDDAAPIRFRQLADERDREALTSGIRLVIELLSHPAVRRITAAVDVPGLDEINGVYHAAGTCRMGRPDDPGAVVDADLRVIGYNGLRVADASIIPILPAAAPMLTCAVIGAHLAARW